MAELQSTLQQKMVLAASDVPSPKKSPNGNGTGFQRVPVLNGYPLNADVAPVADPFFQPLLAVVENATGSLICLI